MAETTSRRLRYVGPHKAVEVPALETTVQRNHQIEVADADLAASLLDQEGNWREVKRRQKGDGQDNDDGGDGQGNDDGDDGAGDDGDAEGADETAGKEGS